MSLRSAFQSPWFHLPLLVGITLYSFSQTTIHPMDDHAHYQKFIELLSQGVIDLSIPGFHGASFFAALLHLVYPTDVTNIYFQLGCALLIVPVGYLAASRLLKDKGLGILFAYALALSPFFFYFSFRGFTFSSYTLFLLISLWLCAIGSRWTWLPLGLSIIIKPFSIALFPLILLWFPQKGKQRWIQLGLSVLIPAVYVLVQYSQAGRIIVGSHIEIDQTNVFQWWRAPLNWAHGIQMLFSVHNHYFPDPSLTRQGNLVHMSPLLMIFGVMALLYPKQYWKDQRLARVWGLCALAAYIIPGLLDHMDQLYLHTAVLLLAIASLGFLQKYPLLIPIVLATFHFQWLYAYLEFQHVFVLQKSFFILPVVVDILFLVWCMLEWKTVRSELRALCTLKSS